MQIMLLLEGAIGLMLVHGDRRYAEVAAGAAKALVHRRKLLMEEAKTATADVTPRSAD